MPSENELKGKARLPKYAVPKRYEIKLKTDLVNCKFYGTVTIDVIIVLPTKFLVLNAADLLITSSSLSFLPYSSSLNTQALQPVKIELLAEDEILVVEFAEELPTGVGKLTIFFQGTLNDSMKGFYRSVYEIDGEKKNMAVTQFEPVDARRCFPCWDEPALKATFKITLEVPSELVALSNMPIAQEIEQGALKTVHFEESPIMSTYLVAVVVGLFDYAERLTSEGMKVRCYCQVGKAYQTEFALDLAVKCLDLYKKFFNEPYPLPKLDLIAIPDFASGAMENYGLITFRETSLLYDEQHSSASNKQWVADTVLHEVAHQWFGNLVTMEWWTDLWLNEGFATWMSYSTTDVFFPEWKIWTQFLDETNNGLRLDSLAESHPIEVEINHPNEVEELFDAISYFKGSSVVRMLQSYLGADCFQRALAAYIRRYSYSNAKTEDLWSVLEEESGEPVKEMMTSWTRQKGYPVVSVTFNDQKLSFEQSQFSLSGCPGDSLWIVPVTLYCGSYDDRQTYLLSTKSGEIEVEDSSWIKVNAEQTGFYRVKYDDKLMTRLQSAIENYLLSASDRFGVLDDSYALCMGGQQSLTSFLSLIASFRKELDYTVLSKLISICHEVVRIVADAAPEILDLIKQFFIRLFQFPAGKLGWDSRPGESHLDTMLRGELMVALAKLGHDTTLAEAVRRFDAYLDDRNSALLPSDVRKPAYVALMQRVSTLDKSAYESLLRVYRETDQSEEKGRILGSLASCPNPEIVLEVLNFLLSCEVRTQDAIIGLKISVEGRAMAWKWFKENWDHISEFWNTGYLLGAFVDAIVSKFSSYEMVKEVEEFFASRSKAYIARKLKQSIESVHINRRWVQSIRKEERLMEVVQDLVVQLAS